jgi:uncharacterized surface protein with fasciclin (FAS1) repeats
MVIINLAGCVKTTSDIPVLVNTGSMIEYMRSNKDYSYMVRAVEKTNLDGLLGVYGTFTGFVPVNKAFTDYFAANNTDSTRFFADVSLLNRVVKYHLMNVRYPSSSFLSGSLPTPTLLGDYLAFDLSLGIRNAIINGTVKIDSFDIKINNGIVHVIDKILVPVQLNLYEWLATQPQYSVILDAFKQTDNDKALKLITYQKYPTGDSVKNLKTLFLETNEVLARSNFKSFDDLAKAYSDTYSTTKQYTNPADGINRFVRYHMLQQKMFTSDVKFNDFIETSVAETFIIFSKTNNVIQINRRKEKVVGVTDSLLRKVNINFQQSNIVTYNGIVNSVDTVFSIYVIPRPIVITWFNGDDINLLPPITPNNFRFLQDADLDTLKYPHPWVKWFFPIPNTLVAGEPSNGYPPAGSMRARGCGNEWWIKLFTKPVLAGNYNIKLFVGANWDSPVYIYLDGVKLGDSFSKAGYTKLVFPKYTTYWLQLANKTYTTRASHEIMIMPCGWGPYVAGATGPNIFLEKVQFEPTAP